MRFCMVTTFYPPYHFGGDGIFVQPLACALAAERHKVEVVHCENDFGLQRKEVSARAMDDDARHHSPSPNTLVASESTGKGRAGKYGGMKKQTSAVRLRGAFVWLLDC